MMMTMKMLDFHLHFRRSQDELNQLILIVSDTAFAKDEDALPKLTLEI